MAKKSITKNGVERKPYRNENGSGSFYENKKNNTFRYRVKLPDGSTKDFYGKSKHECREKYNSYLEELERLKLPYSANATIVDIVLDNLNIQFKANKIKPSTYQRNISTLNIIKNNKIGTIPIKNIVERNVQNFYLDLVDYSNSVIKKVIILMKKAFRIAKERNIIETNIMFFTSLEPPKSNRIDKNITAFTIEEQKKFIEAAQNYVVKNNGIDCRNQMLISLLTGMRMGEVNALREDSIDFENHYIYIDSSISRGVDYKPFVSFGTKTINGVRRVPMSENIELILKNVIKNKKYNRYNLLFYNYRNDSPISTNQVNEAFKRICRKNNITYSNQHSLRHTFATRCIENGIPAIVLSKWLGHSDIKITINTYTDVLDDYESTYRDILNKIGKQ